jgi:site-specific DNA recombinase
MTLVVYSLSRLTRSTTDMLHVSELMEQRGVDLVSLTEKIDTISIDTISAAGKMVFRMLSVLNEFERDLVSERTRNPDIYPHPFTGERLGRDSQ